MAGVDGAVNVSGSPSGSDPVSVMLTGMSWFVPTVWLLATGLRLTLKVTVPVASELSTQSSPVLYVRTSGPVKPGLGV